MVYHLSTVHDNVRFQVNGASVIPEAISPFSTGYLYEVRLRFPRSQPRGSAHATLSIYAGSDQLGDDIPVKFDVCSDSGVVQERWMNVENGTFKTHSWTCLDGNGQSSHGTFGW